MDTPISSPTDTIRQQLETATGRLREVEEELANAEEEASGSGKFKHYLKLIGRLGSDKERLEEEVEALRQQLATETPTLSETQSLIAKRNAVEGPEREALNRKLRAGLEEWVESVWVLIEPITRIKKIAHIQVHLKNEERRTRVVTHPNSPPPDEPDYSNVNLKEWASSTTPDSSRQSSSRSRRKRRPL